MRISGYRFKIIGFYFHSLYLARKFGVNHCDTVITSDRDYRRKQKFLTLYEKMKMDTTFKFNKHRAQVDWLNEQLEPISLAL